MTIPSTFVPFHAIYFRYDGELYPKLSLGKPCIAHSSVSAAASFIQKENEDLQEFHARINQSMHAYAEHDGCKVNELP